MKKRMKVLTALVLSASLAFSLAACGGEEKKEEKKSSAEVVSEDKEDAKEKNEDAKKEKKETPAFENIMVVDNDQFKIELTGIDPDNMWGYTLKMLVENKNADTTYTLSVPDAAVNNVQTEAYFATDVAPGKKANEEINLSNEVWNTNDIGDFSDILLNFEVREANNWDAEPIINETVHVYPLGQDKATVYKREMKDTDKVILDDANATVAVIGYREDEVFGFVVDYYIVNKTDKTIRVSADEVSVNGFMADPYYADVVKTGRVSYSTMSWLSEDFTNNGIESVEDISFTLSVSDEDNWGADPMSVQNIVLNP